MTYSLEDILQNYDVKALQAIATACGIATKENNKRLTPKGQLVSRLIEQLYTPEAVRERWQRLQPNEQTIVSLLSTYDEWPETVMIRQAAVLLGLADPPPERFKMVWGSQRPSYAIGYLGDPTHTPRRVFEDCMAYLTTQGLVLTQTDPEPSRSHHQTDLHPAYYCFVPQEAAQHLTMPPIELHETLDPETIDRVVTGEPRRFLRDLYLYWDHVRRNKVSLIKSGYVGKRGLRAINDALLRRDPSIEGAKREPDARWLYTLRLCLFVLDLVREDDDQLIAECGQEPIPAQWTQPIEEVLATILHYWPKMPINCPAITGDLADFSQLDQGRGRLASLIAMIEPGTWVSTQTLLQMVMTLDASFLFGRMREYGYYIQPLEQIVEDTGIERVNALMLAFVHQELQQALGPMGIVDLGYVGSELVAMRPTPVGRAALYELLATIGSIDRADLEPVDTETVDSPRLVVQPNYQILAMGPVPLSVLAQLDLIAGRQRADAAAFEYTLTRESVYGAQQAGMTANDILSLLEEHADTAIPQNVRRSLMEWGAQHERIVFREGVSLLQAEPELLETLRKDRNIRRALPALVTPNIAEVKRGSNETLLKHLVGRGLMPARVRGSEGEVLDSVAVAADGALRPLQSPPPLAVLGRLNRLAETREDGTWRLTANSVARCASDREEALLLIEQLEELANGPLPPDLVARVKQWSDYYGAARISTLTLIEFRDRETLEELLAHPDLKRRLRPYPAGDRALATVSTAHLQQVEAVLNELGVEVRREP